LKNSVKESISEWEKGGWGEKKEQKGGVGEEGR